MYRGFINMMMGNGIAPSSCPYAVVGSNLLTGVQSGTTVFKPAYGLFDFSTMGDIHLQSVLGAGKQITGVKIFLQGYTTPYTFNNQEIWIGQVSDVEFPTSTPQVDFSDLTFTSPLVKVKDSFPLVVTTNGVWYEFTFDTPFCYDGVNSLLFNWRNYDGSWQSGFGNTYTVTASNRGMYKNQDTTFPTGTGTRVGTVMQLDLLF